MRSLVTNKSGNIAVIASVSLPLILFAAGVAIDFSSAQATKSTMQDNLDAALLAAVLEKESKDRKKIAQKYVKTVNPQFKLENFETDDIGDSRYASAELSFKSPTLFAKALGREKIQIRVAAKASAPLETSFVQVRLHAAQGWFSKVAAVKGTNTVGDLETLVSVEYTYTHPNMSTFEVSSSDWIDVREYSDIHIEFNIDPDSFGWPGNCWLEGCPGTRFATYQPEYSDRFFIDNVQQDRNTTIAFFDTLKCGQIVRHAWEDGGSNSPDLFYDIETRCDHVNPESVYLSY